MAVYGASGAGFAGANLVLARALPTEPYALFTLVIALGNLGYSMAPAGLDGVVNRRHLDAGPALLRGVLRTSILVGLAFAAIGLVAYDMSWPLAAMLFVSTAAGWGWKVLLRERRGTPQGATTFRWSEALSFAGLSASGLLLVQLERLVIPHVLPVADLALYGVLGAIVGSLFRVLQMGVGFSLLPRLRAAGSVQERRRLVAHEGRLVGTIVVGGSAFIWFLAPVVERWFLAGKYHLAASLVLAAIISGVGKIANAFTKSIASALAEPRELSLVNAGGWISVATSIGGALVGARWGLAGLIYGVALGWFLRAAFAAVLMVRHLRLPVTIPVTAP